MNDQGDQMSDENEFISEIEKIIEAEELIFDPTPGFGEYRKFFPDDAVTHPAKINMNLLKHLIERYTKPGETILDPMSGTGSTGVMAAIHGRNAVCIELEKKFYNWILEAKEKVETTPLIIKKGKIMAINGDARKLSELLDEIDVVITSPPYSESLTKKRKGYTIIPALEKTREMPQDTMDDNIANLKHGDIDAIITSPPYADSIKGSGRTLEDVKKRLEEIGYKGKINFSRASALRWQDEGYSMSPKNIGNMDGETYLETMLKVYSEMWKVLKHGGLAVVVVKPFIRNKKVIDLPLQTWILLEKVGFKLIDVLKLRLKVQSFWRTLYYKKYPEVPKLNHEYIIVCEKPFDQEANK